MFRFDALGPWACRFSARAFVSKHFLQRKFVKVI